MSTPIGTLELIAGPLGLRAVLWPGEDGTRVARAVGTVAAGSAAVGSSAAQGGPKEVSAAEGGAAQGKAAPRGAAPRGAAPRGAAQAGAEEGAAAQRGADGAEAHLDRAVEQLSEYFAGTRREFDLSLDPVGTDFQLRVWAALRDIPYGQTRSYGAQAADLGAPSASRAVGAANGRNPLSIVVPCHRVVAASGALTGFAGGLDTKAWLLDHERSVVAGG